MTSFGETWPAGRRRRFAAAFLASLAGHALVLVGVRAWRFESRPAPPLVVTMLEGGRAGEAESGAGPVPPESAPPPAAVAPPAVPAAPVAKRAAPVARRVAVAVPPRSVPLAMPTARSEAVLPEGERGALGGDGAEASVARGGDGDGRGAAHGGGSGRVGEGAGGDGLRAYCASCPTPEYPGRARRQGWQGTVDVELAIASDGAVAEARVGRSSGYPSLDEAALGVARRSRFTVPAGGAGLRGQLRYRFLLDDTAARN